MNLGVCCDFCGKNILGTSPATPSYLKGDEIFQNWQKMGGNVRFSIKMGGGGIR